VNVMRVGPVGAETPVVLVDGSAFDLRPLTTDVDVRFLSDDGLTRISSALEAGELPAIDITGLRVGPPVADIRTVVCIGQNYAAHAAESGAAPPEEPIIFFKHPSAVVGPNDDIHPIPGSAKLDWEVELGVILKKRARQLSTPQEAIECIAGITISNDVSDRYWQIERSGGQWSKGKSWETFNPVGPYLVPVSSVHDLEDLRLQSWVNGNPRQDSSTSDMIFSVSDILMHLSHVMLLDAGDLINTGTPQGVALSGRFAYLTEGDVVRLSISGLGEQECRVVQAP